LSSLRNLSYEIRVRKHADALSNVDDPTILQVDCIDTEKNRKVGYAALDRRYFINIYVSPEYRRRGIGTQLLRYLLNEARKRGIYMVFLVVFLDNLPALRLYHKLKFKRLGIFKREGKAAALMGIYLGRHKLIPIFFSLTFLTFVLIPILKMLPKYLRSILLRQFFSINRLLNLA